jgi:hypothetical protein
LTVQLPAEFPPGLDFDIPLWEKRPEEWLRREYRKGRWGFMRGFQQKAPKEEDRLFGDLTKLLVYGVRVSDLVPADVPTVRYGGFDPSGKNRPGNALTTAVIVPDRGIRVIKRMQLWQGSYKETSSKIILEYEREKHTLVYAENNATQEAIIDLVRMSCPEMPIMGFLTGKNKADLELGVPGLEAEVRNGVWALCMDDPYDTGEPLSQHDAECDCAYHEFLKDLDNYPSPGRSHDLLMSWWFCREAIRGTAMVDATVQAGQAPPEYDLAGGVPEDEVGGYFLHAS